MSEKSTRQSAIRELVAARAVASQEELRQLLELRGLDVTQSTLSRDLRELRLARIPDENGKPRYTFPDAAVEGTRPLYQELLPQLLVSVESVQVFVVVRTVPSGAQPVAAALDSADLDDVLGTIAGDDTVLVICRSEESRERVVGRLEPLLNGG